MSRTVFAGLSGGVDSAVSAALLKEHGYNVVGAFIKIWQPEFIECTWERDRLDAMRVCAALEIPFREIDLSAEYKREVIADLIEGYKNGITPNPDVLCNRVIKFGSFAKWAFEEGADYIATGHYARVEERGGRHVLLRGKDTNKDQSYFLWQLTPRDLEKTIFPVGDLRKDEVRGWARKFDLPVAKKPDSQGLCFVGDIAMSEFLARYIPLMQGDVLDENGAVVGRHDGVALYTLGQRHGFTVSNQGDAGPHFVIARDIKRNTITISSDRERAATREVRIADSNWYNAAPKVERALAQVRYREEPVGATLVTDGDTAVVTLDAPRIAAAGQSLVLYRGNELLGGGTIQE